MHGQTVRAYQTSANGPAGSLPMRFGCFWPAIVMKASLYTAAIASPQKTAAGSGLVKTSVHVSLNYGRMSATSLSSTDEFSNVLEKATAL